MKEEASLSFNHDRPPGRATLNGFGPKWVPYPPNRDATVRLFCFPYAGGGAAIFRSWHLRLPDSLEVWGLQLPGRGNRQFERPYRRTREAVPEITEALGPLLDRPFAFFGHSMGAILSFEVARWMSRQWHVQPEHLFISGRRAPQVPYDDPKDYLKSDEDFVQAVKSLRGTPEEVFENTEMMQLVLPTLRADFELAQTYEYIEDVTLDCPITVLGGTSDEESLECGLEEWAAQTSSRCRSYMFEGDHFFIHSCEAVVLEVCRRELSEICGGR